MFFRKTVSKNILLFNKFFTRSHTDKTITIDTFYKNQLGFLKREEFQTVESTMNLKRFDIYRFDSENIKNPAKFMSYYVNLKECGPMVLDALIKIKDEMDPSLSFRRSCREGICGSCSMNIDGRNTLACLSYIDTNLELPSNVRPLPYFSVVRDLVVDMTNFYTQYKSINPYLQRKTPKEEGQKEYFQSVEDRNKLDGLYECILCACCQSHCPSYWWQPGDYYGPAVLMQAYRWIIDSRDEYTEERLEKISGQKLDRCYQIGACSLTCPKGLDPRNAIEKLKEIYAEYKSNKTESINQL